MTAHEVQLESALEALARLALEQDSKLRDAVAEALEQMTAALGDAQAQHAEQYEALRKERDEAVRLLRKQFEATARRHSAFCNCDTCDREHAITRFLNKVTP